MSRFLLTLVTLVALVACSAAATTQGPAPSGASPERKPVILPVYEPPRVVKPPITPRRLSVPSIKARIIPLAMTGHALIPPSDPKVLGWWGRKVRAPRGTTLLVGHTVHDGGGALDDLEEVAVGTRIHISGVEYTVVRNRIISKAQLARRAPYLFSQRGAHRVVVVTCEDYDPVTGHYASNVVMVAK